MKTERNYWIVALALLMFFVTMISAQMTGTKNGFYYFVWMMVGYYGFKGNFESLKTLMALIIGLNIFGLCVIFLSDEKTISYISTGGKLDLVLGVVIMLIPKLGLYLYSKNKINSYKNQEIIDVKKTHEEQKNSEDKMTPSYAKNSKQLTIDANHKNPIKKETQPLSKVISQDADNLEPLTEDWESALMEFDGDMRVKGLWAKVFSENNGDENKSKAQYIKIRASEIAIVRRKKIEEGRANRYAQASNEMCIRNSAITQMQANGNFPVYRLANGNFAIYASWKYKIYSDYESVQKALVMYSKCELFSREGFVEDIAS
jgi:hypothetical protein